MILILNYKELLENGDTVKLRLLQQVLHFH